MSVPRAKASYSPGSDETTEASEVTCPGRSSQCERLLPSIQLCQIWLSVPLTKVSSWLVARLVETGRDARRPPSLSQPSMGSAQAPSPCVQAIKFDWSRENVMALTFTLGRPLPTWLQLGAVSAAVPVQGLQTITAVSVAMYTAEGELVVGSRAMPLTD